MNKVIYLSIYLSDAGDIFGSDMIVVALKYGSSQGGVIDVCDVGKHIP